MKFKKLFFTLFLLSFASQKSEAQYYFYDGNLYDKDLLTEVGISINVMNCLTDLGGNKGLGKMGFKDFNLGKTKASFGLFGAIQYQYKFGLRIEGTYGRLEADDAVLKGLNGKENMRYNRNLNFRTDIYEIAALAEIHPLFIINNYLENNVAPPRWSPYIAGGIGFFSFNPEGRRPNGTYVALQPLSTEGQGFAEYPNRKPYKLQQINIPVGAGVRYELGPFTNLRFEFIYRILDTDYLDDVSDHYIDPALFSKYFSGQKLADALLMNDRQIVSLTPPNGGGVRGYTSSKDTYFSMNLKLSLVLGRERYR